MCIIKETRYFPETDSTNMEAWRQIQSGAAGDGVCIRAGFQTAGKGQAGLKWESESGSNLLFSVILDTGFLNASRQFLLNKAIALAVREGIAKVCTSHQVQIKWPNDIYSGPNKLAGILIENSIMGSFLKHTVAGIGVNVNQRVFLSGAPNPVSIAGLTGKLEDVEVYYQNICNEIAFWISALKNDETEQIDREYRNRLLGYGESRMYQGNEGAFEGRIEGVSAYGKLLLRTNNILREFDLKEVKFLF